MGDAETPMIREAKPGDVEPLVRLGEHAGHGFTSLPPDGERVAARVERSISGSDPLLVMTLGDRLVGCAGVSARVGDAERAEPFYAYRLERKVHQSPRLGVRHEVEALHLVAEYDGPSLIGTLLLHPSARGRGLGRVLSLSRFLLMAREPARFKPAVIAELRGVIDAGGVSPFWDGLGRHFFRIDYGTADRMSAEDKRFIAELMPTHPIYLPLLPASARAVVGEVHEDTRPALGLLASEGFYRTPMVDIFDAGPVLRCDVAAIRTVREARRLAVRVSDDTGEAGRRGSAAGWLVATLDGPLRVGLGAGPVGGDNAVGLGAAARERLGVSVGDVVLASPLHGERGEQETKR
jgi:arginine N-succinyltransferase